MEATVTNIQRFSLHDGGGIRTVGFLKGCPFRCPWCCNPENLSYEPEESFNEKLCIDCSRRSGEDCIRPSEECPTGAKRLLGEIREASDFAGELVRDSIFFDESHGGVTLSGGECLAPIERQAFVAEVLGAVKAAGVHTAVETTLAMPLSDPAGLVACVDVWLVDFKIADRAESLRVTGIDPDLRDANLRALLDRGAHVIARMPIIPGFTDARANVEANIARAIGLGITEADVLPFHQLGESKYETLGMGYPLSGVTQLSAEDVGWIKELAEAAGLHTVVDGR